MAFFSCLIFRICSSGKFTFFLLYPQESQPLRYLLSTSELIVRNCGVRVKNSNVIGCMLKNDVIFQYGISRVIFFPPFCRNSVTVDRSFGWSMSEKQCEAVRGCKKTAIAEREVIRFLRKSGDFCPF